MVDTFTPADLPVPMKPTFFHCILDNGLHMVKTGTAPLRAGGVASKIGQEFELIQHKNLAFSLTLVAQRDAHLVEPRPVPATTPRPAKISPVMPKVSRFFSSPKKAAKKASREQLEREAATPPPQQRLEPMLMFINREGAFGRAGVTFESVAEQCTARCLVLDLPVQGVADPMPSMPGAPSLNSMSANTMSRRAAEFARNLERPRGTLRLKLFYLPPLPSVPRNLLPENLNECIRGMQNAAWHHAEPWLEGTLTQLGGDCRVSPVSKEVECFLAESDIVVLLFDH